MTAGTEHYRNAERLLAKSDQMVDIAQKTAAVNNYEACRAAQWSADHLTALAQVHATLAKAPAVPVDLSPLRSLVERFDPSSDRGRSRAFKADLLRAIDVLTGGA